ncbi:hypothetical protein F511_27322 [Dorcoceras hygrometricum]|uniref:Uncharacterized protein n=1 Tax=Dorcoceras hygrometricum TaxID=472368 RepID=A0A2Z7BZH5_9LAMI|nr:hypothetical protein F511_27322 [Dorcoceras hygrometricum]
MAGALLAGPPPGPDGPNLTDLGSNRYLTKENWPLQVDAPAMLHRYDHLAGLGVRSPCSGNQCRSPSGWTTPRCEIGAPPEFDHQDPSMAV